MNIILALLAIANVLFAVFGFASPGFPDALAAFNAFSAVLCIAALANSRANA